VFDILERLIQTEPCCQLQFGGSREYHRLGSAPGVRAGLQSLAIAWRPLQQRPRRNNRHHDGHPDMAN